jgi:hypothetical protein
MKQHSTMSTRPAAIFLDNWFLVYTLDNYDQEKESTPFIFLDNDNNFN